MERFKGKNIIITGASGGIGAEIARLCAERGANLVLLARSIDKLENLKKKLEGQYRVRVYVYKLDVSDTDQIQEVFKKICEEIGRVDVLINNAGFGIFREAHEATIDEMKGMFNVNVIGLMVCTRMVLPKMREQRSGHIINIASQAGKIATPKSSVYAATKHAVLGYTNSLRMELADYNVYVTAVNPGPIATNFFQIADEKGTYVKNVKRIMLQPEYVAKKVVDKIFTPAREINLPRWMNAGSIIYTLFPRLFERLGKKAFNQK
ncbi:SDR family NAD(P)-dependent oxidoreductase [Bacillus methanolicus]|uniref:Putative oxidoreductase YqjQ n=1 Tax=Bacillus methanolicus (strain MGA3 / ATCC 53907) TaxID=796606 RepID=I3EA76_BACMM|nr:SDR family oxidoreductase [Bacillus methanolicus]AIE60638.1 putative oxidoreductase YqjQ [Bacillus methanolicus MGA3]EIJ83397.1 oxidoreductase, short-chain dehydrogenase/reductase family protein [Bacillus methanolicus MGA3]UQD52643.1 SDR family NAD(P)-dependent oxidoreductase [Bacillus methanolicus]